MEYIGDPTEEELQEMLATKDLMNNSINQGLSSSQILKKRFKKLDQLLKN